MFAARGRPDLSYGDLCLTVILPSAEMSSTLIAKLVPIAQCRKRARSLRIDISARRDHVRELYTREHSSSTLMNCDDADRSDQRIVDVDGIDSIVRKAAAGAWITRVQRSARIFPVVARDARFSPCTLRERSRRRRIVADVRHSDAVALNDTHVLNQGGRVWSPLEQLGPSGPPVSPRSYVARGRIRAIEFRVSGQRAVADSQTRADGDGPSKQIEPGPLARYTGAAAHVSGYRVEPTIR